MKKKFEFTEKEMFLLLSSIGFAFISPFFYMMMQQTSIDLGLSPHYGFWFCGVLGWFALLGALVLLIQMMKK